MMLSLSTARRLAAFSLAATGLLGARTAAAANVCATIDENADKRLAKAVLQANSTSARAIVRFG